jgi:hypothetical protein
MIVMGLLLVGGGIAVVLVLRLVGSLSERRRAATKLRRAHRLLVSQQADNQRLTAALKAQHNPAADDKASVRTVPSTVPTGLVAPPHSRR